MDEDFLESCSRHSNHIFFEIFEEGCPNLAENLGLAIGMFVGFFLQPSIEIGPMTT